MSDVQDVTLSDAGAPIRVFQESCRVIHRLAHGFYSRCEVAFDAAPRPGSRSAARGRIRDTTPLTTDRVSWVIAADSNPRLRSATRFRIGIRELGDVDQTP